MNLTLKSILQHPGSKPLGFRLSGGVLTLVAIAASACGPAVGGGAPGLGPLTSTPEGATPTQIVWFPPTETRAPPTAVTPEPTPERNPGIGELMFQDAMTSNANWNAATSVEAAAAVSERGLTLAVQPGALPMVSLHRSAVVDDMYMEVTAKTSLCREHDSYGLVFRAPNDVAHYRFALLCDGTAAAQRVSLGTERILQPPTAGADVPVGAPGEVRLGVWASGPELRFFLNDHYQFSSSDGSYLSGGVGVFVEAGGETAVVVTFSDLRVYRLALPKSEPTSSP